MSQHPFDAMNDAAAAQALTAFFQRRLHEINANREEVNTMADDTETTPPTGTPAPPAPSDQADGASGNAAPADETADHDK